MIWSESNRPELGKGASERRARRGASALSIIVAALLLTAASALAVGGQITQLPGTQGCVAESGSGGACAIGHALFSPDSVAASPDGKSVYATFIDGVAVFQRNPSNRALTQPPGTAGCVNEDGSNGCADGHSLDDAFAVAVSPDGKNVYVAADLPSHAVTAFQRDMTTGALTQLPPSGITGCVSQNGSEGCIDGKALGQPVGLAVSPDGKNV